MYNAFENWETRYIKKVGIRMKTTGVIRRIDELGRIVVPKEIRRNLRIRDGESLEIFVENDFVALKKYSPMGDLEEFSKVLVDAVYSSLKSNIMISNRDNIIAIAGPLKKKYLGKPISSFLEGAIENRDNYTLKEVKELELSSGIYEKGLMTLSTIIVNGDPVGLVLILSQDNRISEADEKIINIISQFLGKHIEE